MPEIMTIPTSEEITMSFKFFIQKGSLVALSNPDTETLETGDAPIPTFVSEGAGTLVLDGKEPVLALMFGSF